MTLRFLGAGGAFSRSYGTTCSLITVPSGLRWLVDCGRQAPDQLNATGLGWNDIEGQIVTHVHGDHIGGMEDFAFRRFYENLGDLESVVTGGPRPKLVAHGAVEAELWETLAPSLRYITKGDDRAAGTLDDYFEPIAARGSEPPGDNPWNHSESFRCGELELVARETEHVPGKPCTMLELSVASDGRMAFWSGDSVVDAQYLLSIEPRTTVYFHDCTFTDYPGQVHGSFQLLEKLPEAVRHKMVLMHHEDDIESNRSRAEAIGFRVALPDHVYDLTTGQRVSS